MLSRGHLQELTSGHLTFDDFLRRGIIEFLDVYEENDALIATQVTDITPYETSHILDTSQRRPQGEIPQNCIK